MTLLLTGALLVIALLAACVVALLNIAAAADVTRHCSREATGMTTLASAQHRRR